MPEMLVTTRKIESLTTVLRECNALECKYMNILDKRQHLEMVDSAASTVQLLDYIILCLHICI